MKFVLLLLSLAITWLPGGVLMARQTGPCFPGRIAIVAGYGLLLGLITVPILMRLLSFMGIGLSLGSIGIASGILLLLSLKIPVKIPVSGLAGNRAYLNHLTMWQKLLVGLCLALIVSRLLTLGIEVALRPLFAWDGKQHWAKQAKVFFEAGRVVPFVPFQEWLALKGEGVYTDIHPDYPITIPLLQVWVNTALGEWHDSLMNLPWLMCYSAIGLIFYGQLRVSGAGSVLAIAASYMLLSLPYLNTQVALAGYADIFLAACYLAAVAAFHNWSRDRLHWQGALALFFALAGLLVKNVGFYWLLTFIPGLIFVFASTKRALKGLGFLAVILLLLFWLTPADLAVAGHSLESLALGYRPESWRPIFISFLVHDNWHLLTVLFIGFLLANLVLARAELTSMAPLIATIASALFLYLTLYLFTSLSQGAVEYTTLNRVALQLVPALSFLTALLFQQLFRPQTKEKITL